VMKSDGVQTSVHYPPIHHFSVFQDTHSRPLANTDRLANRILTLPLYAHLSNDQVDTVAQSLAQALDASVQAGVESLQASETA
jgi:dTDP-4-amino-4,6-dideoxygalactose transaminase